MPAPKWRLRRKNDRYEISDLELPDFTVAITYLNNGKETLGHTHPEEEVYIFISGKGIITIGDQSKLIGPGNILYIPGGEFHQVHNIQGEPLVFACVFKGSKE